MVGLKKLLCLCFIKLEILITIVDVNECTGETDNCDDDATCTNTKGSFVCTCDQGYSGNGVTCSGMFFLYKGKLYQVYFIWVLNNGTDK